MLGIHIFEAHGFSGITGGLSAPAPGENRPTIGLLHFGSLDDAHVSRRTLAARAGGVRVVPGVAAWGALGRRPRAPPWGGGARPLARLRCEFASRCAHPETTLAGHASQHRSGCSTMAIELRHPPQAYSSVRYSS